MYIQGINPTRTYDVAEYKLGTVGFDQDGNGYMFVITDAGGITGEGYVVLIEENYVADMLDATNSGGALGWKCGVAKGAVAASTYCWVQVYGDGNIITNGGTVAGVRLNTSSTAGQIGDTAAVGTEVVYGISLYNNTSTTELGNASISWPIVGETL